MSKEHKADSEKVKYKVQLATASHFQNRIEKSIKKGQHGNLRLAPQHNERNYGNGKGRRDSDFPAQTGMDSEKKNYKLTLTPASDFQDMIEGSIKKGKYEDSQLALEHNEKECDNMNMQKDTKEKLKVHLAPPSYFQNKSKGNIKETVSGGLRLAPAQHSVNQSESTLAQLSVNQSESTTIAPGAYAVMGIGANNSMNDEDISAPQRPGSLQHRSSQSLIVADVIDNDADKAKIIGDFIAGTAQATIVEKIPCWKRRNLVLGLLGLSLLLIIGIVVFSLAFRESKEEKLMKVLQAISGKETLERKNSPQNKAYKWLSANEIYLDSITDAFVRERYIAAVFYFSTGGSYWLDKFDFLDNQTSVCEWNDGNVTGIQCNENRMIRSIVAVKNNLTGILPSELSQLSSLESIVVNRNMLDGTISSTFAKLSRLKTFELSSNSFTGTIPTNIFDLRNLIILKMANNSLIGTIQADFTKLSSLEVLDLEENSLSGGIPNKFNRISRLKQISLSSNNFTGSIPETITTLAPTLEYLQLVDNNLSMTIPSSIGSCRRLKGIALDSNSLSGSLPTELGLLIDLQIMRMNNNKLIGRIPSELGDLLRLGVLEISNNRLSGSIPSELGYLRTVGLIALQQNELTGNVPVEVLSLPTLSLFYIHRNNLNGTVKFDLCESPLEVRIDCAPPDPEVECTCCTCYNDDKPLDEVVRGNDCNGTAKQLIEENLIKGSREKVECGCLGTEGLHVQCDESCFSCNLDETICVENLKFQVWINSRYSSFPDRFEVTVKYTEGRNDTIAWGSAGWEDYVIDTCWVKINDIECQSCIVKKCLNNKNAPFVSCSNILGAGNYDGCDGNQVENVGVFEAIRWSTSKDLVNDTYCPVLDPLNIWDNFF